MKVGNSLVLVLPKALVDGFGIQKGQTVDLLARDDGIHIPLIENPIIAPVEQKIQKTLRKKQAQAEKALKPNQSRGVE